MKKLSITLLIFLCVFKLNAQDSINSQSGNITIMTYNVLHEKFQYDYNTNKYVQVISSVKPDVIALQELIKGELFNDLVSQTGMKGKMYATGNRVFENGRKRIGLGIMWNPTFDTPTITNKKYKAHVAAYMVAQFNDFCFISTHYQSAGDRGEDRKNTTQVILNNKIVKNYQKAGKPVYVAGDFNEPPPPIIENGAIQLFIDAGFKVLNDTTITFPTPAYLHKRPNVLDMIIEYNTNPNCKVIERGRIESANNLSDHYPYFVTVKFK